MDDLAHKLANKKRRAIRVRTVVRGSSERPRLSVNVSNLHISAQIIDDGQSTTLLSASSVGSQQKGSMTDKAAWVGAQIAQKARKAKIKKVVFDRGGRKYHGRIKVLADSARKEGLEF